MSSHQQLELDAEEGETPSVNNAHFRHKVSLYNGDIRHGSIETINTGIPLRNG